ncbi:DUF2306 domain-containing protein [Dyadobacter sp. CY261]|uniref:DUF2306 domain-containing protein n=1 Tax=Dyadobacter sp. CY261 TaxID=2907203 RepID=UPI001F2F53BE|nr:DUF2306 domain-containing protein [Dyadobacter sp. CY261]MCF0071040.1 DUF2306 domain-containing protein [Dyadobacter sp. CY261]
MMPKTHPSLSNKQEIVFFPKMLNVAAAAWLTVAFLGQLLFGVYIVIFYGGSTLAGEFDRWNEVLPHGYNEGDWKGNLVVGIHVLLASVIVMGGPLQLISRYRYPRFHRWLGRVYVLMAILVSMAGLTMVWTRGAVGDTTQHIGISIQAGYIIGFALLTIHYARTRQFGKHRNWALRLYMVVNGVWFFRVGLMFWLLINRGPAGFDPKTFTGPFLTALSILTYAIPIQLIVLEMYIYAGKHQGKVFQIITSIIIFISTIITGIGVFGATIGMWLPRLP